MKIRFLYIYILLLFFVLSCTDEKVDDQTPEIDLSFEEAFPTNCDTLYFGEAFTIKALFTDNVELGSVTAFSIDIHNNFDHHSHSTEVTECSLDDVKDPVNPLLLIQSFDLPEGQTRYETSFEINLETGDEDGIYDEGDYHFFMNVTDKEGWTASKGLSIKILYRK